MMHASGVDLAGPEHIMRAREHEDNHVFQTWTSVYRSIKHVSFCMYVGRVWAGEGQTVAKHGEHESMNTVTLFNLATIGRRLPALTWARSNSKHIARDSAQM